MTKRVKLDVPNTSEVVLKKRMASIQREMDKLRLELNQIEGHLNMLVSEEYKTIRFLRMHTPDANMGILNAIKCLREHTHGCLDFYGYFGLKEAKDFCDELKAGQVKILKLSKVLTPQQIHGLKAQFEIEPVVGV